MKFLILIVKLLVLLASVFCMVLPFLLNKAVRDKDRKNGMSYKYFRILIYSVVYAIAITVAMYMLKDIYNWLASLRFIKWIASKISISQRIRYYTAVFSTIVINTGIGFLYLLLQKLVRIGLKKKNLTQPKKNGEFNRRQKAERAVIRFFYNETWFFVGRILKYFNILLSCAYVLIFVMYQIPALSGASWIPYGFLLTLYNAGYIYPVITLLVLWDMYYFLSGIEMTEKECPEVLLDETEDVNTPEVDVNELNALCKRHYANRFSCELRFAEKDGEMDTAAGSGSVAALIGEAIEKDDRNPKLQKAVYVNCLDRLEQNKSMVVEGSFFSEFGMYFLRYISVILAQGENVVFICNNDEQIDAVYEYIYKGLSNISSLYCKGTDTGVNTYDTPIWGILKVSNSKKNAVKSSLDDQSIVVTTPDYICSSDFEVKHKDFIQLIDTVVFVDTVETLTLNAQLMALMNTRFNHVAKTSALSAKNSGMNKGFKARYVFRPIRYVCFDDSIIPGLDKVLKNLLSVDFETADCMQVTPNTVISCYNHEGRKDIQGNTKMTQFVRTDEELGLILNMIMLCRAKGVEQISVFPNNGIPYNYMIESALSNSAKLPFSLNRDDIRVNKYFYNPDKYTAIIAFDQLNNLPDAIRRYAHLAGDKPTLINIISRPYMLRDYYAAHISEFWHGKQLIRIPMCEGTSRDAAMHILVKANSGGISEEELFIIASGDSELSKLASVGNANMLMVSLLKYFGITGTDNNTFYTYFEYSTERDFDETGTYRLENRIHLRKQGKLYDFIEGRNLVKICHGNREYVLPVARDRLTQKYIAGQNLLYNGDIYHINSIDVAEGKLHAKLTTGGKNEEAYEYIQDRRYIIDDSTDNIQMLYPVKKVQFNRAWENMSVSDVTLSAFKAPMEVVTDGYYIIDPHTMECNPKTSRYVSIKNDAYSIQAYRRYGMLAEPEFTSEQVIKNGGYIDNTEASVLSIRINGDFGADTDRVAFLLAVMAGEILNAMFPYVADSIAVVPILRNKISGENPECMDIAALYPQLSLATERSEDGSSIELFVIEDCSSDLGVISTIAASGDDPLHMIFAPILEYLEWYADGSNGDTQEIKKDYLYFGNSSEPSCFDFKAAYALSKILGDDKYELEYVDIDDLVEYAVCDFCGKRFAKGENTVSLEDGRLLCGSCAAQIVGNNKRALKAQLINAKMYLESTYGIELDDNYDVCFESTVKILNTVKADAKLHRRGNDVTLRGYVDTEKKKAYVERDIPTSGVAELLVRQLTYTWQLSCVPELSEELAEGHIAFVAVQYLRFLGFNSQAERRTGYYESNSLASGIGYRMLLRELMKHPEYMNNPFRYVLANQGISIEDKVDDKHKQHDLGDDYVPEEPDRRTDGNVPMFFYDRLSEENKKIYVDMCNAIESYKDSFDAGIASFDDIVKVSRAVSYDKPELFQYINCSVQGSRVNLKYCMDAQRKQELMDKIEAAIPEFTKGITDNMSAYDIALRVHTNIIEAVDYDTIALRKQEQNGRGELELDWLRTICGVFINKKAVCAGYAKAVQFLLHKYGIECGYCVGDMLEKNEDGKISTHAWNILKVDGDYYYMDATWDDSSNTVQTVKKNEISYNYFCVTTEEMKRTRNFAWCPTEMPVCTATKCNYHYHNNAVIDSYDLKKLKEIAEAAATRKADGFSVKCTSVQVYNKAFDELCRNSSDGFELVKAASKKNKNVKANKYGYSKSEKMRIITINFKFEDGGTK